MEVHIRLFTIHANNLFSRPTRWFPGLQEFLGIILSFALFVPSIAIYHWAGDYPPTSLPESSVRNHMSSAGMGDGARIAPRESHINNHDIYAKKLLLVGAAPVDIRGIEPRGFTLSQTVPIQITPSTTIQYSLEKPAQVSLRLYSLLGNEVATLVSARQEAGIYNVPFKTNTGTLSLSSGVYFYRLEAGSLVLTKKLIVMK